MVRERPGTPKASSRPQTPTRTGRATPTSGRATPTSRTPARTAATPSRLGKSAAKSSDVFDAPMSAAKARATRAMRSVDTDGSESDSSDGGSSRRRSPSLSGSDGFATAQENDGPNLISFATPKPISRVRHGSAQPENDGQTQNVVVCVRCAVTRA